MKRYKDIEYIIYFNYRSGHFCAYVRIPDNHPFLEVANKEKEILGHTFSVGYEDLDINTHGGLTFGVMVTENNQNDYPQPFTNGYWVGWDYGHYMDYSARENMFRSASEDKEDEEMKKWQPEEIEQECFSVIDQVLSLAYGEKVKDTKALPNNY